MMFVTSHVVVGASTAVLLVNQGVAPLVSLTASFFSHAVLDRIPHYDYQKPLPAVIDTLAALVLLCLVWRPHFQQLSGYLWLWGGILGAIPDVEVVINYFARKKRRLWYPSHNGLLAHPQWPLVSGTVTQIILVTSVWMLAMQI